MYCLEVAACCWAKMWAPATRRTASRNVFFILFFCSCKYAEDQGCQGANHGLAYERHDHLCSWCPLLAKGPHLGGDLCLGFAGGPQGSFCVVYHECGVAGIDDGTVEIAKASHECGRDERDQDTRLYGFTVGEGPVLAAAHFAHTQPDAGYEAQGAKKPSIGSYLCCGDMVMKKRVVHPTYDGEAADQPKSANGSGGQAVFC